MAKTKGDQTNFSGGISDGEKLGLPNSFKFGRSIQFRDDPSKITILPRTTKDSGTVVTELIKRADRRKGGTDTTTSDFLFDIPEIPPCN